MLNLKLAKFLPGLIGALMDMMKGKAPLEALRKFITPENAEMLSGGIGGFINNLEKQHGCKIAITLRATDDGKSGFIDLLNAETLAPVARFTKNNLDQLVAEHGSRK